MLFVFRTYTAIIGATLVGLSSGVEKLRAHVIVFLGPIILLIASPVQVVEVAVFWACLVYLDLPVFFIDPCIDNLEAFGAQTLRILDEVHPITQSLRRSSQSFRRVSF